MGFGALLLRADEEEVEDHEHQQDGNELDEHAPAAVPEKALGMRR